ncbi:MAG: hypothetical protein NXI32_22885 [bacterium]|nr:hypothetical protein [bacterium]
MIYEIARQLFFSHNVQGFVAFRNRTIEGVAQACLRAATLLVSKATEEGCTSDELEAAAEILKSRITQFNIPDFIDEIDHSPVVDEAVSDAKLCVPILYADSELDFGDLLPANPDGDPEDPVEPVKQDPEKTEPDPPPTPDEPEADSGEDEGDKPSPEKAPISIDLLTEHKIPASLVDEFYKAGINSVQELMAYDAEKKITVFDGVGEKTRQIILDACHALLKDAE